MLDLTKDIFQWYNQSLPKKVNECSMFYFTQFSKIIDTCIMQIDKIQLSLLHKNRVTRWSFIGPLKPGGETRCPEGVTISWLASCTCHGCLRNKKDICMYTHQNLIWQENQRKFVKEIYFAFNNLFPEGETGLFKSYTKWRMSRNVRCLAYITPFRPCINFKIA